jgi:hypothetical protein
MRRMEILLLKLRKGNKTFPCQKELLSGKG